MSNSLSLLSFHTAIPESNREGRQDYNAEPVTLHLCFSDLSVADFGPDFFTGPKTGQG